MSESTSRSTQASRLFNTPEGDDVDYSKLRHTPTAPASSPETSFGMRCLKSRDPRIRQSYREEPPKDAYSKPRCKTTTAENEMKLQYAILKEEYYRICQQEATLRNHMALLGAEIILMQTKAYHKCPANVRRINIDPITIRKVERRRQRNDVIGNVVLPNMDRGTGTGRYFVKKSKDHAIIPHCNSNIVKEPRPNTKKIVSKEKEMGGIDGYRGIVDRCFYFEIPSAVVSPPYLRRGQEMVTRHRLPKLKLPKIKNN